MGVPRTSEVTADGDRVRLAFRPPSPNFWVLLTPATWNFQKTPAEMQISTEKTSGAKNAV